MRSSLEKFQKTQGRGIGVGVVGVWGVGVVDVGGWSQESWGRVGGVAVRKGLGSGELETRELGSGELESGGGGQGSCG